ncbi:MAG: c-type cytochrome [Sulfuricella sp.]|nr:c-type cytochrome [Sulfuricella sp.]
MIEYRFHALVLFALLAPCAALLGGCGKKENPSALSPPSSPISQMPAPVAPEAVAPTEKAAAAMASTEAAMRKSDCFTCHAVDKKIIGPAYSWVAYRYKDDKEATANLSAKIKNGGMGNWNDYTGGATMSPHRQLQDDDTKAMAQWVLGRNPVEPPAKTAAK